MPTTEMQFDTNALYGVETNVPTPELVSGTNVKKIVWAFDDTTEEYINGKLKVPTDVDTGGTVTFRAFCMAKTAAASKNVALTFGHSARDNDEDYDAAYTDEDSGNKAIPDTQDDVAEVSWTETVSNLGWQAHDLVYFRLSRYQASVNNLSGDLYLDLFVVEIPVS
jgi:hypothetical protein